MTNPSASKEDEVIKETYAATLNPARLSDFETFWEAYIDAHIQNDPEGFDLNKTSVDAHITIAMGLLEKVNRANNDILQVQDLVQSHYGFGFIIDKMGRLVSSNTDAADFTSGFDNLSDLPIDKSAINEMMKWLSKDTQSYKFFRVYEKNNSKPSTWFASPITIDRQSTGRAPLHFLITSVETKLSSESRDVIGASLGLSQAETEVAGLLAAGQSPKEVATFRDVKITAVRTQIVNIKEKMGAKDIPDVVRKFISMGLRATAARSQIQRMEEIKGLNRKTVRQSVITLRDGREMQCYEQGHPRGKIILQIHSLISGVEFPESASQALVKHGYRMISPCRAGYGNSSINRQTSTKKVIEEAVKDMIDILDFLNAEHVILLTGWAGGIAQKLALKDSRVKGLVLSGAVPVWRRDYLNILSPRYRTLLKTSIYAPKASPYLARLGKALIDSSRANMFIGSLDKLNEVDRTALLDKEVYRLVEERFKYLVKQSIWPFCEDLPYVHTDWTEDSKQLKIPVKIIIGTENFDQPPAAINHFREALPASDLHQIEGAGTYQNLTHFKDILEIIRGLNISD